MVKFNTEAPIKEIVLDTLGMFTKTWQDYFALISDVLFYSGSEQSQTLINNQAVAVKINDLSFDKRYVSGGYVDYLIQRTSTTDDKTEAGTFFVSYKLGTAAWQIASAPSVAGVTITINSNGECFYTTTNQSGTGVLSRIVFRARSIRGKTTLYSSLGNAGTR